MKFLTPCDRCSIVIQISYVRFEDGDAGDERGGGWEKSYGILHLVAVGLIFVDFVLRNLTSIPYLCKISSVKAKSYTCFLSIKTFFLLFFTKHTQQRGTARDGEIYY